jgi:hypothetical protein
MKWYQLHLSTLLALMLLAGVLVWLNVPMRPVALPHRLRPDPFNLARGWPMTFQWSYDGPEGDHSRGFDYQHASLDVTVCLLLLAVAGAGIEWVTRRMRRKI